MLKNTLARGWVPTTAIALIALLVGFGAARFFTPKVASPAAPAAAPAKKAEPNGVRIPPEYLATANIAVEPIQSRAVGADILAPATVAATPGQEAVIVTRVAGTVQRINRRLGDQVRAGEVLAMVDSADAAALAADLTVAKAKADLAKKSMDRESQLFEQGVTPRQDMEQAKAAYDVAIAEARRASTAARVANLADDGRSVAVVSPIAGRVSAQSITLGAYLAPQTESFRVAASGDVQVEAFVTAADVGRLQQGADATVLLPNGSPLPAKIRALTPTVSGGSRSATVIVVPLHSSDRLIIGEGVQVRLRTQADVAGAMSVPEEAVQNLDGRDVLFVRTAEGFKAHPILVGTRSGGFAQIISGVEPGVQVATRNAFLLKAEMNKRGGDDE